MNAVVLSLLPMPTIDATWQAAIIRFPTVDANDPSAAGACLWADPANQRIQPGEPTQFAALTANDLLETLILFARDAQPGGARPTRIELADPALCDALRDQLRGLNIDIALVRSLKIVELVTEGMQNMFAARAVQLTRLETVPGMTEPNLRSFADAAQIFYEAAPWTHFDDQILLRIISPTVEKDFRHINVLGNGGEQFGLAFFPTYQRFKRLIESKDPIQFMADHPSWSITYDPPESLAPADLETWSRLNLPVCQDQMYPVPLRYDGHDGFDYPNPAQLQEMELLLRTVASLKPADFETQHRKHLLIDTAASPQKVVVERLHYFDYQESGRQLFQSLDYLPETDPTARTTRKRKRSN